MDGLAADIKSGMIERGGLIIAIVDRKVVMIL